MPFAVNPFTNKLDYYKDGGGGGGTVTSVNGVANRTTVTDPTTDPIVDIAATYVGQTSITTLGTIGTGTWNGSTIGPTFGGTGLTTYTTGDLLYSSASNTLSKCSISTILGSRLVASNTGIPVWSKTVGGPDIFFIEDDFVYYNTNAAINWPWRRDATGTGATSQIGTASAGHPGVYTLNTGTDANSECSLVKGLSDSSGLTGNVVLGGGSHEFYFVVNVNTLATVSEDYKIFFGLGDSLEIFASPPGNNFVGFEYLRSNSVNWQGLTISGGVQTVASGGSNVPVSTGWVTCRMTINAAANSVNFYVGGTLIGTSTTNIPTGQLSWGFHLRKTAGTTPIGFDIDYTSWFNQLTTSRF